MKRNKENYRSNKSRKRALHINQRGHSDGFTYTTLGISFAGLDIINRLKNAFRKSKHRAARIARFKSKQRRGR